MAVSGTVSQRNQSIAEPRRRINQFRGRQRYVLQPLLIPSTVEKSQICLLHSRHVRRCRFPVSRIARYSRWKLHIRPRCHALNEILQRIIRDRHARHIQYPLASVCGFSLSWTNLSIGLASFARKEAPTFGNKQLCSRRLCLWLMTVVSSSFWVTENFAPPHFALPRFQWQRFCFF